MSAFAAGNAVVLAIALRANADAINDAPRVVTNCLRFIVVLSPFPVVFGVVARSVFRMLSQTAFESAQSALMSPSLPNFRRFIGFPGISDLTLYALNGPCKVTSRE